MSFADCSLPRRQLGKNPGHPKIGISMDEIEKNDYNLNISRYVSTAKAEAEIDLAAVNAELIEIEKKIASAAKNHNKYLKELGLPPV